MAFVWAESWHGISANPDGTGDATDELTLIYGNGNAFRSGFGQLAVLPNFDNGQPALVITDAATNAGLRMSPGIVGNHNFSSQREWFIHFAVLINNTTVPLFANNRADFLVFEDLSVYPLEVRQCHFSLKNNGPLGYSFQLRNYDTSTLIIENDAVDNLGVPGIYYIQLYVKIGDGSGASRLIVAGKEMWNTTGLSTQNPSNLNNTANSLLWQIGLANDMDLRFANIVIADGQDDGLTPPFNDLMGEFIVGKISPNAPGDNQDFNPVGALANWDCVNDYPNPDNSDVTYNQSSTSGNKDILNYENIDPLPNGTIYGINLRTKARKTDAGARTLTNKLKSTSTEYDGYTLGMLSSYAWLSDSVAINQDTGDRYTVAEINDHQFGYELG